MLIDELSQIDIGSYIWQPYRRFIIPKDEYSYRVAIQLDPIDNLLFVAITYQIGKQIEDKRVPEKENKVFNYRFNPNDDGELYYRKDAWKKFWNSAEEKIRYYKYAVYIDIADFYNKMLSFKALGYPSLKECIPQNVPMVQITNTNENKVDINVSFDTVRREIENMSALPDAEIGEILGRIDELEKIVKSSERRSKKWENAKEIIKWIADKGVDVGIALLPLLLQIK